MNKTFVIIFIKKSSTMTCSDKYWVYVGSIDTLLYYRYALRSVPSAFSHTCGLNRLNVGHRL